MQNGNVEYHPMIGLPDETTRLLGGKDNIVSAIKIEASNPNANNPLGHLKSDVDPERYYALTKDGGLWGWGGNNGRLGDGTKADRDRPVKIAENVKRLLPKYFVTNSNDWCYYSDTHNDFKPRIAFQNTLYVYSTSGNFATDGTWFTPDGKLVRSNRPRAEIGGPVKYGVRVIIDDIKLPSIVRADDGQVIAPRPEQIAQRPPMANIPEASVLFPVKADDDKADKVDLIAVIKETNFLDVCLPQRNKMVQSERMANLTIGEAFDSVPIFSQQVWTPQPSADGKTIATLTFSISNRSGKRSRVQMPFTLDDATQLPQGYVMLDGVRLNQNKTVEFFNTMYNELVKAGF